MDVYASPVCQLYHGTWSDFYTNIISDGIIKSLFTIKSDITSLVDNFLELYGENPNLRKNAIYLSDNPKHLDTYDYIFTICIDNVDIEKLYVADYSIISQLYDAIIKKKPKQLIMKLIKSYEESFISYKVYTYNSEKTIIPEFLYFGDISIFKYTKNEG